MIYIDLGYVVALVVLTLYALSLVGRERAARRRLGGTSTPGLSPVRRGRPERGADGR